MSTVTVPAQVLQDLIFNAELIVAGQGNRVVEEQCHKLQRCLDGFHTGGNSEDNVIHFDFKYRRK